MKLMNFTKRKVVALGLAGGMAAGAGGIAAAYFAAGGSGHGSATVGTPVPFSVTQSKVYYITSNGTPMPALYPGGLAQPVFTVKNTASFSEHATTTLADFAIVQHGTTIAATRTGNTAVAGCKAAWFTLTANGTTTLTVTLQRHTSGTTSAQTSVDLNMKTTGTQLACAGKQPIVTLTFSS